MPYLLLACTVLFTTGQSLSNKQYTMRNADRPHSIALFNVLMAGAALSVYGVWSCFGFAFDVSTLWYGLGWGLTFCVHQFGMIMAIKTGPLSLTSLFVQLSLILPIVYGYIFWNETATVLSYVGLPLVVVSVVLCLYKKRAQAEDGVPAINMRWIFYVVLAAGGNAICAIVQKQQQLATGGAYKQLLMVVAMAVATVFYFCIFMCSPKQQTIETLRRTGWLGVASGFCNAGLNIIVLFLATMLASQIVYPVVCVGGLILVQLAARLIYRERLHPVQWIGIALGAVAVLLLNL